MMRDRREHVLVLVEIAAAENGFRGELDTGVAHELGVDVEAYRHYRQVCAAIDQFELAHEDLRALLPDEARPGEELETAGRIIDHALDLHRSWRGSSGWHPGAVSTHARRILASALTLKGQLERRALDLEPSREREVGLEH